MGKRHCWKCQTRHGKPTGQKCRRIPQDLPDNTGKSRDDDTIPPEKPADVLPEGKSITNPPRDADVYEHTDKSSEMEKRLDSMENLLYKLTENIWPNKDVGQTPSRKHRSPSRSSVDTSVDTHKRSRRRQSRESPSRYCYKYDSDNYFREEETQASSFETIMVAVFRTITDLYEDGEEISGVLSHGQYMAEKAAANVYVSDAFTGYDRYVRQVASRKGPQAFATISELERSRYFNLENYREVRAFRARNKPQGGQKNKSATCRHYNGENGCFARSCQYVHRCSACEVVGHSARECKVGKKDKSPK